MKHALVILLIGIASIAATRPSTRPARAASAPSTAPATKPTESTGDPALDFLLNAATDAPVRTTTRPATQGVNPFVDRKDPGGARPGTIILSNGEKLRGRIASTLDKPIRVWIEAEKAYFNVAFGEMKSAEAKVLWERQEKEWRFRESGSDVKEYSGDAYPLRELEYVITLVDGRIVRGGVVSPIYLQTHDGHATYVLHKRQKGQVGQTLKDLVYVVRVE